MLTVTHEASEAIRTLTDQPFEADEVVESEGATVYLAEPVVAFLDDKTLDAEIQDEGVAFSIHGSAEPTP